MKATGIVRRIDDLGRVVIPKEIRRTMRIREGDPLEIYTTRDGEVIFKKYSPMGELQSFAAQICESIGKNTGHIAAVADRTLPDRMYIRGAGGDGNRFNDGIQRTADGALLFNPAGFSDSEHCKAFHKQHLL